ncbi:peroxin Pex22-like protein [Cordyceps javanica]|nr:peroxin Pex22-like protein [Cordyceps javanica]
MPSPNDRRRGVWSHWVPLVVTVTIASAGLVAWALSQRKEEEHPSYDQEHEHLDYENADYGDNPPYGATNRGPRPGPGPGPGPGPNSQSRPGYSAASRNGEDAYGTQAEASGSNWGARMSGALRRTPSPQQFFDSTGKTITAGVAAAGAVIGKTLASIREEDKYPDDSRVWSEEADAKKERGPVYGDKRRRTVAVVVSADSPLGRFADDESHEHASILSHIPRHNDFSRIKLFVLIYAPDLKDNALENATTQTPGEETKSPIASTENTAFNAVYSQALALVDKEAMILPFTTPNGHVHILRHLQPEVIYLQESLAGDNGSIITNMQTWLRHDIMLVVGADSGSGGLADSESEAERTTKTQQWWQRSDRVGRGRGIIVVDSMRVNDDWARRVTGKE